MADVVQFGRDGKKIVANTLMTTTPEKRFLGTKADTEEAEIRPPRAGKAAIALKISGASYEEIASILDYTSPAAARVAVEKALAASVDTDSDYKTLRAVASRQLNSLLHSVWTRAHDETDDEQPTYFRMALSIVDRTIKLHGIDAPQMITIVDPSAAEFERVIAMAAARLGPTVADEGDIFALEQAPDSETWGAADEQP